MTPSTRSFSKRARVLGSGTAVAAVAGVFLVGGIAPAQAQEPAPVVASDEVQVAALYNGYYIENRSGVTLTLQSKSQAHNNGWGTEPPQVIEPIQPGQEGEYFEVKYWLGYKDDSTLVYTNPSGDVVTFKANVYYTPLSGSTVKFTDLSSVSAVFGKSEVEKSGGLGLQTIFRYFG